MIDKTIHYCWFGNKEKPDKVKRCIDTWCSKLIDYTIKEWNETNWDINKYKYSKSAYENKKMAFVSDICRIDVLNSFGGITFDADIEVIKPFSDEILSHKGFTSLETSGRWISAVIASEKNHSWIKEILNYYQSNEFIYDPEKVTNTVIIDTINKKLFSHEKNGVLFLKDDVAIYPREFFEACDWSTKKIDITKNTYTVHRYMASWL